MFRTTTNRRSSTAITSFPALVAMAIFAVFSVGVAVFQPSPLWTLLLLPLPALLTYAVARAAVGVPPTTAGMKGKAPRARRGLPRYQLVAMPINHFGEKLRWTLDVLGAPYDESTVGGILSASLRGRSVPWLVDRVSCSRIGNSDEALWYLAAVHVPTMEPEAARRATALMQRTPETMAWEARLNALGHAIQGWAYFYLLGPQADAELSLRFWGGREPTVPVLQRLAVRIGHPVFSAAVRDLFDLRDAAKHEARRATIAAILDEADAALQRHDGKFLTGASLSYVDIGFCALLGPLLPSTVLPLWANGRFTSFAPLQDHPSMPSALREFELELRARPCGQHIERTYREHRERRP